MGKGKPIMIGQPVSLLQEYIQLEQLTLMVVVIVI